MPKPTVHAQESEDIFSDDDSKPMIACTLQASPTIARDTAFHLAGIDDHENITDSCFQLKHAASGTSLAMQSRGGRSILAPNFGDNGSNTFFRCSLADSAAVVGCRRLASYKSVFECVLRVPLHNRMLLFLLKHRMLHFLLERRAASRACRYLIALVGLDVTMSSEFVSAAIHHFEDLTRCCCCCGGGCCC